MKCIAIKENGNVCINMQKFGKYCGVHKKYFFIEDVNIDKIILSPKY